MEHTSTSPEQAAERLAIRELLDAYAHCADRREAEGQKALFTEDTHFLVYMNGVGTEPTEDLHGQNQLTPRVRGSQTFSRSATCTSNSVTRGRWGDSRGGRRPRSQPRSGAWPATSGRARTAEGPSQ
jgi:SnoaL-like domain